MATQIDIFNNALVLLGSPTVTNVNQNARSAQSLLAIYDSVRRAELRKKPAWNFSIKLATLNANAITPIYGRGYSYPLPIDFLAMAPQFPESNYYNNDWLIQDRQIFTAQGGTINVRYVADVDESYFDPLFVDSLSAALARKGCNAITQSKGMFQVVDATYKESIMEARKANAFDNVPQQLPVDPWIVARF